MNTTKAMSNVLGVLLVIAGLVYVLIAFKLTSSLGRFALNGPVWANLALAGLFAGSGLIMMVHDPRLKQLSNLVTIISFGALIAWGVFGMGK